MKETGRSSAHLYFIGAIVVVALFFWLRGPSGGVYIIENLSGPQEMSILPEKQDTAWKQYHGGSKSRLAILLTDEESDWLGLARGLKSIGVPFSITTDYKEALQHKVVMVYPMIAGSRMSREALQAVAQFPRNGGTLIGFNVLGGGMNTLFGFSDVVPFRARNKLVFTNAQAETDVSEREIPLSAGPVDENAMGVYAYTLSTASPVATYEDGSAAITERKVGAGKAIAFGVDVGNFLHKGYNNRQINIARSYDNGYEPTLDVLLRLIAKIYREGNPDAVTLGVVPEGKRLAAVMTHDVDYTKSLPNALAYAAFEHASGIRSTYFIQTKYIKDYNDQPILGKDSADILGRLKELGMEVASHSVAHSSQMDRFPLGDGQETYPEYRPFVRSRKRTDDATILGELRVSRFLLESLTPDVSVKSFRPGELKNPFALPQALAASGYEYSSSVTANDSLTHLPFQLTYGREKTQVLPVFEFPVTLEDEWGKLEERLPESVALAKKIAVHGGLCVVLIHPNVVEPKLTFEKKFIEAVKGFAWFGSMEDIGAWWAARNAVGVDMWREKGRVIARLEVPAEIKGLTLINPAGMRAAAGQKDVIKSDKTTTVLGPVQGTTDIVFVR